MLPPSFNGVSSVSHSFRVAMQCTVLLDNTSSTGGRRNGKKRACEGKKRNKTKTHREKRKKRTVDQVPSPVPSSPIHSGGNQCALCSPSKPKSRNKKIKKRWGKNKARDTKSQQKETGQADATPLTTYPYTTTRPTDPARPRVHPPE